MRWLPVGACQGLCGLHKVVQPFPFPWALSALAWPRRTMFMSCVIADLSLSRRPASVKIGLCSLQARLKSHHLPPSDHVSHNPLPDEADGPQAFWLDKGEIKNGTSIMSHKTTSHVHKNPNTLFLIHSARPAMGAHTWSEQAAVKWGPVGELLAGLVETAKAWFSLAVMTFATLSSPGSMLVCCCYCCQEAGRGKVKHNRLWSED